MRMRMLCGWPIAALALACIPLSACGPDGGVASAGSLPVAATIADATLPPPAAVSPLAKTIADDRAIHEAFQRLDDAASAADVILAIKPSFAGTPAAKAMARALTGAKVWLNIASEAQRAAQADNYKTALEQASAALTGARAAIAAAKGK